MVLLVGFIGVVIAGMSFPTPPNYEAVNASIVSDGTIVLYSAQSEIAQTFTIGIGGLNGTYNFTGISIEGGKRGTPSYNTTARVNVTLQNMSGYVMSENSTVDASKLPSWAGCAPNCAMSNITMPSVTLEKGKQYKFVLNASLHVTDDITWKANTTGGYAGGNATINGVYGDLINDTLFIVWGIPTTFDGFIENSQTYNKSVYETDSETISLNLTYDSSIFSSSAVLNYNGTSYIGTKVGSGDNAVFYKKIDVPLTNKIVNSTNASFYWEITLSNSTNNYYYNSSFYNQTIVPLIFTKCNHTYVAPFVNFTVYNETSLINLTANMDSTFFYGLQPSTIYKNYSMTDSNYTFRFCTNVNKTFYTNSIIKASATGYYDRTSYLLLRNYTNVTTEESLYLTSEGTNVIVQIKDSTMMPEEDIYTDIYRYYPGNNSYQLVISEVSDLYGEFTARLVENTAKYTFIFKNSTGSTLKTAKDITIACKATICILPFILEDTTNDFSRFENVSNYDWTFTFNNNTHIFLFTWTDVSGVSATNRLYVERTLINGTTSVCNSTSTAAAGSLSCNVGSSSASYRAQIFRKIGSGTESRLAVLNEKVGTASRTFGKEGLIWSFFLMMTCIAFGFWKPPVGILLYGVSFLILTMLPIIYVNPAILIAEGVIVIVFIWAFRS